MEVIYTGLHQTPEQIARTALQEDVDVVGLSIHSGSHMTLFPLIHQELTKLGMGDVLLIAGGIIPEEDRKQLEASGFGRIFGPGTPTQEIASYIETEIQKKRQ
jgi:methylmalonyl-CoA mutase C-terminal domain/subunit